MRKLLILLLLSSPVFGQWAGNAPNAVQGFISQIIGATDWQITPPENVTSGNLEVACVTVNDPAGPVTYTATSSLGGSFSNTTPLWDATHQYETLMYYRLAPSSGSDTISFNIPAHKNYSIVFGEFKKITATTDGTASNTLTTTNQSVAATTTTTTDGDLIISCVGMNHSQAAASGTDQPIALASINSGAPAMLSMTQTGTHGAYTITDVAQNGDVIASPSYPTYLGLQSVAFKTAALAVTTTLLPNTDKVQTYGGCLQSVGSTGALTWTVGSGSLPTGISLSSAGCFSGVASGTTSSFVAHLVDAGTGTNADSGSLSLAVDNTPYGSPLVVQSQLTGFLPVTLPNVVAGNTVLIMMHGFDAHGTSGWLNADAGAANFISDSQGDTYRRACPIAGTANAPFVVYSAKIASNGTLTISFTKTSPGSSLTLIVEEVTGTQSILDCAGQGYVANNSASPFTVSSSVTTQVANDMLLAVTDSSFVLGGSWSMAFPAGYSSGPAGTGLCCYDFMAAATKQATTATSYSETTTVTDSAHYTGDSTTTMLIGLRPGIVTVNPVTFSGERPRRQIY